MIDHRRFFQFRLERRSALEEPTLVGDALCSRGSSQTYDVGLQLRNGVRQPMGKDAISNQSKDCAAARADDAPRLFELIVIHRPRRFPYQAAPAQ